MATAQDIIKRAFVTAKIIAGTETLSSQDADDGLVYLNDLLEALSNEHLMIFQNVEESHTMDGSTSYTWGSGGDIATTRPLKITNVYHRLSGTNVDTDVHVLTKDEYDAISDKTITSDAPDYVYLYTDFPLAKLYVYPVASAGTLYITSWKQLTSLASLTTSVSLPPGYERMLRYALAAEIAPEYGQMNELGWLEQRAMQAKAGIKRVNNKLPISTLHFPIYGTTGGSIERGY